MDRVGHIVRRRAVFFAPGFDPAPPRAWRERYRREAAHLHRRGLCNGRGVVLLAMLARAYRFDLITGRPPPRPVAHLTLRAANGIWLNITQR